MPFPQLNEEDFERINHALDELLRRSEASSVLLVERAGYLISQVGNAENFDTTTVATLAANAFNATQFMVDCLAETQFSSMYQQGHDKSVLWVKIDEDSLLIIVFPAKQSVGMVKFYALAAVKRVADQLESSRNRAPTATFDIASLNPTDVADLFKKKN